MSTVKLIGLPAKDRLKFTKKNPSPRYLALLAMYKQMHQEGYIASNKNAQETFSGGSLAPNIEAIHKLIQKHDITTLLDFGAGKGALYEPAPGQPQDSRFKTLPAWGAHTTVTCYDPGYAPYAAEYEKTYEAVISTDVVEHIPEDDIPWLLDDLFATASKAIYIVAACYPAKKKLPDGTNAHCAIKRPSWWIKQIKAAADSHPAVDWVLCTQVKSYFTMENRRKLHKQGTKIRHFYADPALSSAR